MMKRSESAIRRQLALACASSCFLLTGTAALAQTSTEAPPSADEDSREVETVLVTGSRLSQAEFQGGLPVGLYTGADIEKSTAMSLNNYLRSIPTSYGVDNIDEGTVNGGDGRASVGLRGLPTVTLINGRRQAATDLNMIPLIAVEKVEILKDGNGAVYGADAVGGVINIVTKKKFDGVEFDAFYQNTTDKDISRRRFEMIYGASNAKGSMVFGLSHFEQNDLYSSDRDDVTETSDLSAAATSSTPNPGKFRFTAEQAQALGLGSAAGFYRVDNDVSVATGPGDLRLGDYASSNADRFPYALYTPTVRPAERTTVFGSGEWSLLDDKVEFYTDVFYTRAYSEAALAPSPASHGTYNDTDIPADYYWNRQVFGENAVDITNWSYRWLDLGSRRNKVTFDDLAVTFGLRGDITDRIRYDASWYRNKNEQLDEEFGGISPTRLADMLHGDSPFSGADLWNPFTNPFDSGEVVQNPDALAYLELVPRTRRQYTTQVSNFTVSAEPFDLPAGPVEVAGGYEFRKETFTRDPDLAKQDAFNSGWNSTSYEHTAFDVQSLFAEALVPVVVDAPLMQKLQIGAAVRQEDFSHLKDKATVGRLYLRNQFNRELTARLSYSEGYTAPTPLDLSDTVSQDFPVVWMPWIGLSDQPDDGVELVGSTDLKPTKSKSYNVGLVWAPRMVNGLSVSLDYYTARQSDIIIQDPQLYIDAFYAGGGVSGGPDVFTKNNSAPYANQIDIDLDGSATGIPGYIISVSGVAIQNLAELSASGLDFEVRYDLQTTNLGRFTWRLEGTRILKYEIEKMPGLLPATVYDGVFTPNDGVGPATVPHWRGFLTTDWLFKGFATSLRANYCGAYREDPTGGTEFTSTIKAWTTFDLTVGYTLERTNTSITLGVENLFDKMPPRAVSSFADKYDRSAHNILGRMISIGVNQKF